MFEIGNFNYGMLAVDDGIRQPHFRSLNCTGIMRGKKFEFAMTNRLRTTINGNTWGSGIWSVYGTLCCPNNKGQPCQARRYFGGGPLGPCEEASVRESLALIGPITNDQSSYLARGPCGR
jgi:hypothetical protein